MPTEVDSLRWYLIRTQRGKEAWARKELEHVAVETFLPLIGVAKPGEKPRPLFPRCVFARLDLRHHYFEAKYTPGIRSVLFAGGEPVEVPGAVIEGLRTFGAAKQKGESVPEGQTGLDSEIRAMSNSRLSSMERMAILFKAIESQGRNRA